MLAVCVLPLRTPRATPQSSKKTSFPSSPTLSQVITASVQHRIAIDEHKRLQQQQAAEKRRVRNQVTKKVTLEQIAAAEVKRCEKVKKREAMDNDEIKNLVALCGF